MKKILFAIALTLGLLACTENFEDANRDHYLISDEELDQDFNRLGSPFMGLLSNLFGHQLEEDLCHDNWTRMLGCPTPYIGGVNNNTYYIRWNVFWDRIYPYVMSPAEQVIKQADASGYKVYSAWAKLMQILGASKLTAYHGPIIYSNFGIPGKSNIYDKESDLYSKFFADLDAVQAVFAANKDYKGLTKFDASYNGDVEKWSKLVNSIRLRLAIRISKVNPVLAKNQGEKAISDKAGLISSNSENFTISLYGQILPMAEICFDWGDTRMGAAMESFGVGMKDNRITSFFAPVTDASLVKDHPDWPYKGVHSGAYLIAKDQRLPFSTINESFKTTATRRFFTYSEVCHLKAEAALRGWSGAGDAKTNYENGVKASFADWGASGAEVYLADATNKPINYIDPKDARNNFISRSDITVAWNNADSNERKLEKIITQKWFNNFTNSLEAWVDHRRTGYPKLPYNTKNDSSSDWGVIPADQFIKRLPFMDSERNSNKEGVADATSKLGGPDLISTRLWWDTGSANNF